MRATFPTGLIPAGRDVARGLAAGDIEYVDTSGTTTEQVTNVWHQAWWNASEAASWKLNTHTAHLTHHHRAAELTSARNVGVLSADDLPLGRRTLGTLLFLNEKASVLEWHERHYVRMLDELRAFAPAMLEANPALLARLAWWAADRGVEPYQPEVVLFTYELPSAAQLQAIRRVFRSPLCSSYGATELGYVFMQCEHGKLHQNVESCRVDFEPLRPEHGGPVIGRVLVTTFDNPWVSVLRFDPGDLVRVDPTQTCPCGRTEGLILEAVLGRVANATFAVDGRLVTTRDVDEALGAVAGVRDHVLCETDPGRYHVDLVVAPGTPGVEAACAAALRRLYGAAAVVDVAARPELEPTASGKYRRTRTARSWEEEALFP